MIRRFAKELRPGDLVFPPYSIETDTVRRVEAIPSPRRGESWFRVFTRNGAYDVGCDYPWTLPS